VCFVCSSPSVQRCSKCNAVYYCGQRCQLSHWSTHKKVRHSSPLLSAPSALRLMRSVYLHTIRSQPDAQSLCTTVTYFSDLLNRTLLSTLINTYFSLIRFSVHRPPSSSCNPHHHSHCLSLFLSISLSGATQQPCTGSCIPHPSRREVRQCYLSPSHTHYS
jgi:hypothetical protein